MNGKVEITGTGRLETISLNGDNGTITAGTNGANGILSLHDDSSKLWWGVLINSKNRSFLINKALTPNEVGGAFPVISMSGATGDVGVGGNGQNGDVAIYPASVHGADRNEKNATIHLDGASGNIRVAGDLICQNADCAEDFEIADCSEVVPGTVMIIGEDGILRQSDRSYDKRVAGVISGAKDLKPGIVLGRTPSSQLRHPVALVGQVYCQVDATYDPIGVGDLLTTSPTPGHAMRATDSLKAFGAVIGKALSPLKVGQGLVRILVALQ